MAKEIRFVVGSEEDIRSSVWRLWANKKDLYLAARTIASKSKISFHASGIYRLAIVSQSPRPALHKWKRPQPTDPGVTPIIDIVVPAFVAEDRFCDRLPSGKPTAFIDPPHTDTKVIVRVLLADSGLAEADLRALAGSMPVTFHGCVPVKNENAWITSYYDSFKQHELEFVKTLLHTTKVNTDPPYERKEDIHFAYMHSLDISANPPTIVDIQLGTANFDIRN